MHVDKCYCQKCGQPLREFWNSAKTRFDKDLGKRIVDRKTTLVCPSWNPIVSFHDTAELLNGYVMYQCEYGIFGI